MKNLLDIRLFFIFKLMLGKLLTADERLYLEEKKLKLPASHDFANDPQFKEWLNELTNNILDGMFPREMRDVGENKEALRYLQKHPSKKLESDEDTCVKLFEPLYPDRFSACRRRLSSRRNQVEDVEDKNKLYHNYKLKNITDLKEIFKLIDEIGKNPPFKIAFDCGFIIEDTVEGTYSLSYPSVDALGKNVPMTIVGPSDVQLFKHLVFSTLSDYTSEVHAVSAGSRYHYVAVHSILFQKTNFGRGGARVLIPGYDFLVKNKYIRDYGNENNLCMFHVVANTKK